VSCGCIVVRYPCFGCVPPPGLEHKVSHCMRREGRYQKNACSYARKEGEWCPWRTVECRACELVYLENRAHRVCPVCSRKENPSAARR
jgi:hypothetical protein